ncbi:MAG: hypothetical protein ACRDGM_07980 [bacterium]
MLLLITAGVVAFCGAFILGQILIIGFGVSPGSLSSAATFGPGSDALGSALKGPFGPGVTPVDDSEVSHPAIARAIERLTRELLWLRSPWRFALNNVLVVLITTILLPWAGILLAVRSRDARRAKQCLWLCLLFAPLLFHVVMESRFGFWTAAQLVGRGQLPFSVLRHGVPEVLAWLLCAVVPVHYYLVHVRRKSQVGFSTYSMRQLGTYAASLALLVLAAFIEAGRLWE